MMVAVGRIITVPREMVSKVKIL